MTEAVASAFGAFLERNVGSEIEILLSKKESFASSMSIRKEMSHSQMKVVRS